MRAGAGDDWDHDRGTLRLHTDVMFEAGSPVLGYVLIIVIYRCCPGPLFCRVGLLLLPGLQKPEPAWQQFQIMYLQVGTSEH